MTQSELIAYQDKQRTARNFISLLGGAFGIDQSPAMQDGYSYNNPGGYQSIGQGGMYSIEGQPISNVQGGVVVSSGFMMLAALAAVAYLALKK